MNTKNLFRRQHSFDVRSREAKRILGKYDDKVPVIVTRSSTSRSKVPDIDKNKFLCPEDLTVGQFLTVIRKRISLSPEESIFLFVDDSLLVPTSSSMGEVYRENKNEDGFLYFTYCNENTFGNM